MFLLEKIDFKLECIKIIIERVKYYEQFDIKRYPRRTIKAFVVYQFMYQAVRAVFLL